MAKIKIKPEQVIEAIKATGGKVTGVCEMLQIDRSTFYRYVENNKHIAEALDFAHVRLIDRAEYQLMAAIERGESWAIQLALKDSKRGKERGYGNSLDVTTGGDKITNPYASMSDEALVAEIERILNANKSAA